VFFGHGYSLRRGGLTLKNGNHVEIKLRAWLAVASPGILRRTIIGVQESFRNMNGETRKPSVDWP
jgi:hypothetical protein